MTSYRKKLIEVGLPLAAINAESAREKSIRHGHPSTLHLWWARRPLAACRAVLFSSLVDDPDSDPHYHKSNGSVDEERAGIKRADLFNLIEELVMWENSNNPDVIRTARAEIARCVASRLIETGVLKKDALIGLNTTAYDLLVRGHCRPIPLGLDTKVGRVRFSFDVSGLPPADVVNAFLAEHAPPVLDPFAGGGSIPLEAQRLGLRAYASDLNPVPVLINKALIEIPPKFAGRPPVNPESCTESAVIKGKVKKQRWLVEKDWPGATGLADDVRYYGQWMRDEAEKRIGHLYPKVAVTAQMAQDRPDLLPYVGQQLTVIAWIWARTVASPNPAANGSHVPLIRSFWLSTKEGKKTWIEPIIDTNDMTYRFEIRSGEGTPRAGTIGKNGDKCLLTSSVITRAYIRDEGKAGRIRNRLTAMVVETRSGRLFLSPVDAHESTARNVKPPPGLLDTDIVGDTRYLTPTTYGFTKHCDLFTARQLVALSTLGDLVNEARTSVLQHSDGDVSYADAVATYLALACSRVSDVSNSFCRWENTKTQVCGMFSRQAISMLWDFAETNAFSGSTGDLVVSIGNVAKVIENLPAEGVADVRQISATSLSDWNTSVIVSTDPPYYDNVPYADLSDFFYVWLRRMLHDVYPDLLRTVLVPKHEELVADPFRQGGKEKAKVFFERGMRGVFNKIRTTCDVSVPTTIYYAFKQSEGEDDDDAEESEEVGASRTSTGWETFLQGLSDTGWQIQGTWPIRTERSVRTRSLGSNALASSIILVCRPRPGNASLATRKEFITTLRHELPDALRNLQRGNIAPVDLAQAAIGPGMAVFTRYAKVIESDGSSMRIRTALGIINHSLDEVLAEQEGEFDSDTRWALAWFEQFGMAEGPFGDAETLSKAKNTAVNGLVEAGIIVAHAGKVRLVKRDELPVDWNPATDKRLTAWEVTQHLIHRLDQQGELGASTLVSQLGSVAETSRDLAYRLYSTCERKKWAQDALAYNSLVVAWPELRKLALSSQNRQTSTQQNLFN